MSVVVVEGDVFSVPLCPGVLSGCFHFQSVVVILENLADKGLNQINPKQYIITTS